MLRVAAAEGATPETVPPLGTDVVERNIALPAKRHAKVKHAAGHQRPQEGRTFGIGLWEGTGRRPEGGPENVGFDAIRIMGLPCKRLGNGEAR